MKRKYRHELKYFISRAEYELISRKLALTMDRDENAPESGRYFIRSLYFDDYENSMFNDKLAGDDHRDKYRIRIYNLSDSIIRLERKHKESSFILKDSLALTREQCDLLINGQFTFLLQIGNSPAQKKLAREFYAAFRLGNFKPRVLVDYWREAYVFHQEDVRVTFDMNLHTAFRAVNIFDRALPTYPALDEYGMILEIKFNAYLPGYIHALIQPVQNAQRSAISKYAMCRKYE